MSIQEMKDMVRQFWGGMNNGDLESQLALCSQDVVFTVTGTTAVSGSNVGKDQVRAHLENFGSLIEPNPRMEIRQLIAEVDIIVCLSEGTMQAQTGRPYNNRYAFVFQFKDGKIASITEYLDTVLVETALFGKDIS